MKNKLQGIAIGIIIGVVFSLSFVSASGTSTSIDVYFKNLRFLFDGVEKKTEQRSFIYEGTTYVPIRFVSEALGLPVKYFGETETIRIGRIYDAPPAMTIDQEQTYEATITTTKGSFKVELFAKDAPKTVNNFVFLAKDGFYDNVLFHRIVQSFVIQTGDPTGTGRGGPGYEFEDELDNGHKYEIGTVAMANAGEDTNGSQFFVCSGANCDNLNKNPNYSIFGKVSEGMEVVTAIAATPVELSEYGEPTKPTEEVRIEKIEITVKPQ
ncbi:peptidylprolyl isomerase [Paenibacillus oceani]|uniref:Peptidyl-prolyl cis-trans isomerase n=1 Tax=Paenibacillus oceani TaxID=2772510 RepID=A0A927C7T3_9BACL|nr:peptidylprolyl isomerase [Paenibacillus oceani]MBD2862979.1 peptidylprolyl isomerase [Paenibacillus oceani]